MDPMLAKQQGLPLGSGIRRYGYHNEEMPYMHFDPKPLIPTAPQPNIQQLLQFLMAERAGLSQQPIAPASEE